MRFAPLFLLPLVVACSGEKEETGAMDDTADTDSGVDTSTNALTDLALIQGKTYTFSFADATISQPATLGSIIGAYMQAPLMFNVTAASETEVDFLGGLGVVDSDPVTQDTCAPTYDFAATAFDPSSPTFDAGPVDATLYVMGVAVPVYQVHITGAFASDGSVINNMTFGGLVDTRPIGPLLNSGGGEDAVCKQAVNMGVKCVPCPDNTTFCLDLLADGITAPQVSSGVTPVASGC